MNILETIQNRKRRADADADADFLRAMESSEFRRNETRISKMSMAAAMGEIGADAGYRELLARRAVLAAKLSLNVVPRYVCGRCGDTGYTDGKPCACLKAEIDEAVKACCGLAPQGALSFKLDIGSFKSAAHGMFLAKLYQKFEEYGARFPGAVNTFLFLGEAGTGKTYLAATVAADFLERGRAAEVLTAYKLNNTFVSAHIGKLGEKEAAMEALALPDLLVIDDLGTEVGFKGFADYLLMILNERQKSVRTTIITTNLMQSALLNRYGEAIFTRLTDAGKSACVQFMGANLRRNAAAGE